MRHQTRTHFHVIIRQHNTWLIKLMRDDQIAWIRTAFVFDARVDIEFEVIEEVGGHVFQPRWTINVHADGLPGDPCVIDQRTELQIVIGMMMSDEYVPKPVERDARSYQLPRRSVATVNNIRNVVDQDQRRGIASTFGNAWSTLRAQQDNSRRLSFVDVKVERLKAAKLSRRQSRNSLRVGFISTDYTDRRDLKAKFLWINAGDAVPRRRRKMR